MTIAVIHESGMGNSMGGIWSGVCRMDSALLGMLGLHNGTAQLFASGMLSRENHFTPRSQNTSLQESGCGIASPL